MRILVTGAAGFLGRWVIKELLSHGHEVVATDRVPIPREEPNNRSTVIYADIADSMAILNAANGCDSILHFGAYPTPRASSDEMIRVNVIGTQNILDAATAHGMKQVVMTSSVGALGFSFPTHPCLPDYLPVDAQHPRRPQDIYGLTKLMNEESAAAMTRRTGLCTVIFRPPHIMDLERAKQNGWLTQMVDRIGSHRHESLWAYIDVRDMAIACRLAVETPLEGHHILYPMVDDLTAKATPQELIQKYLPTLLPFAERLPGRSFYDLVPTRSLLGFEAKRTWGAMLETGS